MPGRRRYQPNDKDRRIVEQMAIGGARQSDVAAVLDVDAKTLRKYYRKELDTSAARANAQVAGTLFKIATSGESAAASIFWMKSRCGWKESNRLEHTGQGQHLPSIEAVRALLNPGTPRPPEDPDETPIKD